jgi:hypothetical protein
VTERGTAARSVAVMHKNTALLTTAALALTAAGCGSSTTHSSSSTASTATTTSKGVNPTAKETAPPGDIPDSTAFVPFKLPGGSFSVKVPEGWARTGAGSKATFTSNLNSVTVEGRPATGTLSPASVKAREIHALEGALNSFKLDSVTPVKRAGQTAIRVRYLAKAKPNAVTGKSVTDAVELYLFTHNGKEAALTLAGPNGADNVDAWRTMSNSLRWGA